jgi:diguanylate cyclase (GGDEF)-like protein
VRLRAPFGFSERDRERTLDMERYVAPHRARFAVITTLMLVVCFGLRAVPLLLAFGVLFTIGEVGRRRSPRPERWLGAAWLAGIALIGGELALTGGLTSPFLLWLLVPTLGMSIRLGRAGVVIGLGAATITILLVGLFVPASGVLRGAVDIIGPAGALVVVGLGLDALVCSDAQSRNDAVLDPLTGMLNRKALISRARELADQSLRNHEPVSVILGDVDHFKLVNDHHGHAAGDAVLCDIAYALHKELRAYDLAYRLGGEEFLILLPGSDIHHAADLAERLRYAIENIQTDGIPVTMSFGVSAPTTGEPFDLDTLLASADVALYRAKATGRNHVATAAVAATSVPTHSVAV